MVQIFRSRQEAQAVAKKLARRFPANDYEAWPDGRGFWLLVVRFRDEAGHIRFKFVEISLKDRVVTGKTASSARTTNGPDGSRTAPALAPVA